MSKFLVRRARPYAAGYFYDDWEYRFAPEFALSAPNAQPHTKRPLPMRLSTMIRSMNYKFRSGKFTVPPLGLETAYAQPRFIPFAERSLTSNSNSKPGYRGHDSWFSFFQTNCLGPRWSVQGQEMTPFRAGIDNGTGPSRLLSTLMHNLFANVIGSS